MKDNKVKVNGKEFSVQATLGEGAFAFVYKCKAPDGSLVAIKSLQLQDSAAQEEALAEAALFKQIPFHPYLVKFIDSESHRGQLFIVQELLGESLFSMMQKKSERPNDFFDDLFVLTVVSQISSALAHLHSMDIFHRDVKPENILLAAKSPRNLWKLCDFGSARRGIAAPTNEEQRASLEREIEAKTSLSYRAPEMLDLFRCVHFFVVVVVFFFFFFILRSFFPQQRSADWRSC
jgi:serine/threonine protein kinase